MQDEKYTTLSPNNTLELSFVKVMGPEILLAELPSDIAKYCPSNYTVYLTRQVQVTKEALSQKQMSLDDPLAKKELKFGDPVPDFKELFDILPPSALRRLSRAKRECRSPDGQTVYDNCSFANVCELFILIAHQVLVVLHVFSSYRLSVMLDVQLQVLSMIVKIKSTTANTFYSVLLLG